MIEFVSLAHNANSNSGFHHLYHVLFQVAVSALLGDTPKLVEYGTALMSNLATKEVRTQNIMG